MHRILAFAAIGVGCSVASGDVIIGNLGDVSGGGTLFGESATTQYKAAGFTMGDEAYFLDSVTLTIGRATDGSTAHVQIWEGENEPQSMIADLTDFSFPAFNVETDFTWEPDSQLVLEADTTYWVYVDNIFEPGDEWLWESGNTTPTGPGATSAGFHFNGGPSSFMNTYQVDGTIVPAPAGLAMLALGGVAACRRRR